MIHPDLDTATLIAFCSRQVSKTIGLKTDGRTLLDDRGEILAEWLDDTHVQMNTLNPTLDIKKIEPFLAYWGGFYDVEVSHGENEQHKLNIATKNVDKPISTEQARAVLDYAQKHGRTWKSQLNSDWMKARTRGPLHMLRNTHGPAWLEKVEIRTLNDVLVAAGEVL